MCATPFITHFACALSIKVCSLTQIRASMSVSLNKVPLSIPYHCFLQRWLVRVPRGHLASRCRIISLRLNRLNGCLTIPSTINHILRRSPQRTQHVALISVSEAAFASQQLLPLLPPIPRAKPDNVSLSYAFSKHCVVTIQPCTGCIEGKTVAAATAAAEQRPYTSQCGQRSALKHSARLPCLIGSLSQHYHQQQPCQSSQRQCCHPAAHAAA